MPPTWVTSSDFPAMSLGAREANVPGPRRGTREGILPLQRGALPGGGGAEPRAPDTYLQLAVQTWEVAVGPKGGLEGVQEEGGVGAVRGVPRRAQLVGHGEELGLHLHRVQQQYGAGDAEDRPWVLGAGAGKGSRRAHVPAGGQERGWGLRGPSSKGKAYDLLLSSFQLGSSKTF